MNWKRDEVAIRWGNDIHRDQVIRTRPTQVATQQTEHTVQSYTFGGWGLGAPGFDGPSASHSRPEHSPPSIRKRCARGFPQGTAGPLRHASRPCGPFSLCASANSCVPGPPGSGPVHMISSSGDDGAPRQRPRLPLPAQLNTGHSESTWSGAGHVAFWVSGHLWGAAVCASLEQVIAFRVPQTWTGGKYFFGQAHWAGGFQGHGRGDWK